MTTKCRPELFEEPLATAMERQREAVRLNTGRVTYDCHEAQYVGNNLVRCAQGHILETLSGVSLERVLRGWMRPVCLTCPDYDDGDGPEERDTGNPQVIDDLCLGRKAANALRRGGVHFVWELTSRSISEVHDMRWIGDVAVAEIEQALWKANLSLRRN